MRRWRKWGCCRPITAWKTKQRGSKLKFSVTYRIQHPAWADYSGFKYWNSGLQIRQASIPGNPHTNKQLDKFSSVGEGGSTGEGGGGRERAKKNGNGSGIIFSKRWTLTGKGTILIHPAHHDHSVLLSPLSCTLWSSKSELKSIIDRLYIIYIQVRLIDYSDMINQFIMDY